MPLSEGDFLWEGSPAFKSTSGLETFMRWLEAERGLVFADYEALRLWSIGDIEALWAAVWDYFEILSDAPYDSVLTSRDMPGATWFPGARVNYAEHILRHEATSPDKPVLYHSAEIRPLARTSWRELGDQVRALATALRARGVAPGDRVVSYMPNLPETVVAMLATVAIGAVWSSAAPEFGARTVVDRFSQIAPKVLFAADGYGFGGKLFDRRPEVAEILAEIPSIERLVWLDYAGLGAPSGVSAPVETWSALVSEPGPPREAFRFERVDSDHPLWVLYSSGTTGLPKAIVHSHVGVLVESLKAGAFHSNLKPGSVIFFYSTTGWMMWNALMQAPLLGGAAVLFDGSPSYGGVDALWRLAEQSGATLFGASPTYIEIMRRQGVTPRERFDLAALDTVLLSGSPATPETFSWFYENVKTDLWVTSQSGGTEFCSGLVVAVPTLPVYAGEIQARALGADVRVLDEAGREIVDQVGELVIAQPMPSMPIRLWGDQDFVRYRETYFDAYPGLWRHGDFMKVNGRGGCYVYGRSDATLNRYGVRIGSAEIYRTLEQMEGVVDSLIVCIEESDGGFFMPLFVQLPEGATLDAPRITMIQDALRIERSPRHVPDVILQVPAIPYTLSGKKMEVPVRKLLSNRGPDQAFSRDSMRNPDAMDWFVAFAQARASA